MAGLTVTIFAFCFIGSSIGATLPKALIDLETTLEYLGQYDTKLYFTDRTRKVNANEAKSICAVNNMTAVQFENFDELHTVSAFLSLSTRYWTLGVNAPKFVWGVDGGEVHDSLVVNGAADGRAPSCVYVTWEELWEGTCDRFSELYDYFPLCQVNVQNLSYL